MWHRPLGPIMVLILGILWAPFSVHAQKAIFVVRHASPQRLLALDKIPDDAPLSELGRERAAVLAGRLKDAGITAIYTSEILRAVQTAEPLADALGLPINKMPREDIDGLVSRVRDRHPKDTVLIVGHWNTLPKIIKALGHLEEVKIERSEYNGLYTVIPQSQGPPMVLLIRY